MNKGGATVYSEEFLIATEVRYVDSKV